jgi:RimJ/RimL family protein N-acetyltransferase
MDTSLTLTDGFITIRLLQSEDAPELAAAVRESLAELAPWMDWATADYDKVLATNWITLCRDNWLHDKGFQFAITDAVTGQYLGGCGLDGINPKYRFANLGYWVRTSRTRQGIASRAARLAAQFAFEKTDLIRVEIVIAVGNLPSRRAAEKAGATYEGILRNRMTIRDQYCDAVMFSLVPADFGL